MLQLQFLNFAKPPMWLVESTYQVGSAAQCNCVIDLPGVLPQHAQLLIDNDQAQLTPIAAHTAVNGTLITTPTLIGHGDTLEFGGALIAVVDPKLARKASSPSSFAPTPAVDADVTQVIKIARSSWYLQPMSTALEPNVIEMSGKMILGRAKECDVRLNFAHLSRRHAVLTVTPQGLELEDLGSSNGTFVNDVKVRRVMLKNGDVLSFDNLRFRIVGPEEETDKTQLRPSTDIEENPTYLRPDQAVGAPMAAAMRQRAAPNITRPSSGQETDDSRKGRMFLLVGTLTVILLFTTLIFFLLR
ncbi:MAG TPA: FHA domain-containing protein [Cellvibrionaceae bacterium]